MNLEKSYTDLEKLYAFLYDNDIDNLSDDNKEILAKNIRKCIHIVDDYEHLLEQMSV